MRKRKKLPKWAEKEYHSQRLDFPRLSKPRKEYDDEIEDQGQFMEDGFEITLTDSYF